MTLDPIPKTYWSTFLKYPKLVDSLGRIHPAMSDMELFVIKMYSQKSATASIDNLRVELFLRTNDQEKLPPTHNSLTLHVMRIWVEIRRRHVAVTFDGIGSHPICV